MTLPYLPGVLLRTLKVAAASNYGCPRNTDLMERFSCALGPILDAFAHLEREGLIVVERGKNNRVVTIVSNGHRTAGEVTGARRSLKATRVTPPPCKNYRSQSDAIAADRGQRLEAERVNTAFLTRIEEYFARHHPGCPAHLSVVRALDEAA